MDAFISEPVLRTAPAQAELLPKTIYFSLIIFVFLWQYRLLIEVFPIYRALMYHFLNAIIIYSSYFIQSGQGRAL